MPGTCTGTGSTCRSSSSQEEDVEAFALEMPGWVEYANAEYTRGEHLPFVDALENARQRAKALEQRLHR